MIKSFAHKGLKAFYDTGSIKGVQSIHAKRLNLILTLLDEADTLTDLNSPALRLHPLQDKQQGLWALTVQANWRITFRFEDGDVYVVDYWDYH
jgi:toxin HigB-1